jgi:deazaflavin-dependent oxidoreductase (nitroreductase family)
MRVSAAAFVLVLAGGTLADEPPLPEVAAALGRVARESTIELTTTGRKSGKQHARPIWFVVADGKLVVQAGKDGKVDWYQNLMKTPTATARQGDYMFRVRGRRVDEPARVEAIHRLFLEKYTSAWLLSFVGSSIGRGRPVELEPISVAVQRNVKR